MRIWNQLVHQLIKGLFPPRCAGCGIWEEALFCADCRRLARYIHGPVCAVCGIPFDPLAQATLCAQCRPSRTNKAPDFTALRSCFVFEGPPREAIHRFKYQGQSSLADLLARELSGFLSCDCRDTLQIPRCDLITPVPLHWWRAHRRGYNQSELLAKHLASRLDIPAKVLLRRVKPTRPQVELDRKQRTANVKNAFEAETTAAPLIKGKTILLIDDVCTTGATLRECATALKRNGAAAIYALTVARPVFNNREAEETG